MKTQIKFVLFSLTFLLTLISFNKLNAAKPVKVFEKDGNIFVQFDNGSSRQITFSGKDKEPQLSNKRNFAICLRDYENKSVNNDTSSERKIRTDIIYIDFAGFVESVIVRGCKDENDRADIEYGNSRIYPFVSLCDIEKPMIAPDDKGIYFQTSAWATSPAIHYYNIKEKRILFYHAGWLREFDRKGNVKITVTGIDKGRYTQDWLMDKIGTEIKPLSEKEY